MQRLHDPLSHQQVTSTGTGDVKPVTLPPGTVAVLINATTTNMRLTLDGTTPSSTNGNVIVAAQQPFYLAISFTTQKILKFCSAAAGNCIGDITALG